MEYKIYRIADRTQIDQCELFAINQYLWNSLQTPKAYGRAGYIDGQGIYVEMTCEECDPKRLCNKDKELVYKDSALEAFFAFPEGDMSIEKQCIYINFEMNANGALYAEKGYTRENRTLISDVYYQEADCRAKIESDRWCVSVLIPEALLGENRDKDFTAIFIKSQRTTRSSILDVTVRLRAKNQIFIFQSVLQRR